MKDEPVVSGAHGTAPTTMISDQQVGPCMLECIEAVYQSAVYHVCCGHHEVAVSCAATREDGVKDCLGAVKAVALQLHADSLHACSYRPLWPGPISVQHMTVQVGSRRVPAAVRPQPCDP